MKLFKFKPVGHGDPRYTMRIDLHSVIAWQADWYDDSTEMLRIHAQGQLHPIHVQVTRAEVERFEFAMEALPR